MAQRRVVSAAAPKTTSGATISSSGTTHDGRVMRIFDQSMNTRGRACWCVPSGDGQLQNRTDDALHRTGSRRENGYRESFNSELRGEFLNGEIFYSMKEYARWLNAGASTKHRQTKLFLGLSTTCSRSVADLIGKGHGEVETASRFSTPRRRLSELRDKRATLTIQLAQKER